jgi:hypothetical protein
MARELVGYLVLEDADVEAGYIEPYEDSYYYDRDAARTARREAGKGWSVYELTRKERS